MEKQKERKPILIGFYNKSVILTYIGLSASINGILLLLSARQEQSFDHLGMAILSLVIAGICDMFDGTIARRCKRTEEEKLFGIQLDSLVDVVSFLAYPTVILFYVTGDSPTVYLISLLYIINGIIRLAWFNIKTEENKGVYQGLPVTTAAIIIPLAYLILRETNAMMHIDIVFEFLYSLIAILFTLNFKFKKPQGKFQIAMVALAIVFLLWFIF